MTNINYIDPLMKKAYENSIAVNYRKKEKLGTSRIENGYVLPYKNKKFALNKVGRGGVLMNSRKYVETSSAQASGGMAVRMYGGYLFKDYKTINEEVIYFGNFKRQWGHFLVDWIVRVWYLLDDKTNRRIVYIGDEINGIYKEFLQLVGIDTRRLFHVDFVTQFQTIIVPEPAHFPGKYYTDEYKKIFDVAIEKAMLKIQNIKKYKKIYLSRKNMRKNGMEIGEELIEKIYTENGYHPICPENFSLEEQIYLLQNAEYIATTEGTLAHNIVFAKDGVNLTIINKKYSLNPHQFIINQIKKAEVTYVDSHITYFDTTPPGPYVLTVSSNMINYLKENSMKYSSKSPDLSKKEKKSLLLWMLKRYIPTHKRKFILTLYNMMFNKKSLDRKIYLYSYKNDRRRESK